MFGKKSQEREMSGKPIKPKDVCYVAVYNNGGYEFDKAAIIGEFINPGYANINLFDVKAYEKEIEAEKSVLESIKKMAIESESLKEIFTPKYLETHKKEDLKSNAYWIFTVEGNPRDITSLLSKDHPKMGSQGGPHEDFAKKILSARNTKNNNLIIASAVRENKSPRPT